MKKLALLLCVFILLSCVSCKSSEEEIIHVSMIQLIANPEKYDGQFVCVIGVVNLEFEGNAIYLSEDDYIYGIFKNGLAIDFDERAISYYEAAKYNGEFVIIEGRFYQNNLGIYSGSIIGITRYDLWEQRDLIRK